MSQKLRLVLWLVLPLIPYVILQLRFIGGLRHLALIIGAASGAGSSRGGTDARGGTNSVMRRHVAKRSLSTLCGCMFWIVCVIASSNTLSLSRYVSELVSGAELSFVIDVSNSMLSEDGGRSRLDAAKGFVSRIASGVEGASLSVLAFRGSPVTLCPLTRDRRAFDDALLWAGPSVSTAAGSDIGAAIDEAARPIMQAGISRFIVVLTDGNDTGGNARAAAERAADSGASLAFVGFGTKKAQPVLDPDGHPVLGADGNTMQTSLDDEAMRAWAAAGGGHYVGIEDAHAYARIASLCEEAARSTGTRRNVRVETDVSPALALVALGFLGLALLLSGPQSTRKTSEEGHRPSVTRRGLTRGSTAMLNIIVVISISFFLSSCVEIEAFTTLRANRLYRSGFIHEAAAAYLKAGAGENPIASYNMANFFILQGEREPAMEMFESAIASGQTELVARSWYNIGIALYTEADYEGSLSSFRKALEAYIDTSEPIHKRSNPRNEERRRQMARAYELALRAQAERRDAGATERGRYGAGSALGELRPFALSRTDEKTLFAPGESASSVMEDQ